MITSDRSAGWAGFSRWDPGSKIHSIGRVLLRADVPHLDEDRCRAPDIAAAVALVRSGHLDRAAGEDPRPEVV